MVYFEEAYEDAESVYLVTELCTGGPIWEPGSGTDPKNFTEEQVARFMRDVLRVIAQVRQQGSCLWVIARGVLRVTIALSPQKVSSGRTWPPSSQCHSKQLLHRDIKPGNFLLASKHRDAPLKAIDLGLAAPFVPGKPREDLGLDGTPYYIAPEVLRSETWPQVTPELGSGLAAAKWWPGVEVQKTLDM